MQFLLIILFCVLGVITGVATGLFPGLHVNNVALILFSLSTVIVETLHPLFSVTPGVTKQFLLVLIAVYLIAVSISHTFHDIIPTTFLGAPDEDTALSVLPAHQLLLEGRGYEAVSLSAMGSYGAILFCFLILYPTRFIIGGPVFLYSTLQEVMAFILIAISILMIGTEKGKITIFGADGKLSALIGMSFAAFIFFISGVFGLVVLDFPLDSPVGLPTSPALLPALAGLFGLPTLMTSFITKPLIPEQELKENSLIKENRNASLISIITGGIAGIFVSIFPGITSATGTVLAMNLRGESNKRQTIVTLSAVNTACAFFVVIMLFIVLKSRSGATLAVMQLITIEEWTSFLMPLDLIYLLIAILLGGTLSYFFTLKIGKIFAKHVTKIPYRLLVCLTILMIITLVFLFTGILGLFILFVAMFIGLLPVLWGVRRSHCMGILLLPIILYFL